MVQLPQCSLVRPARGFHPAFWGINTKLACVDIKRTHMVIFCSLFFLVLVWQCKIWWKCSSLARCSFRFSFGVKSSGRVKSRHKTEYALITAVYSSQLWVQIGFYHKEGAYIWGETLTTVVAFVEVSRLKKTEELLCRCLRSFCFVFCFLISWLNVHLIRQLLFPRIHQSSLFVWMDLRLR